MSAFCAAHRGLSAKHPENTRVAFEQAVAAGFPALEMDLRLTRDGEVVVLHDAGIERTTDGNGRVADMRYDELRGYTTGAGPVPRLDDLLQKLAKEGGWNGWWDLEIKAKEATVPTLNLVQHHGLAGRTTITSMDPSVLMLVQEHAPEVPRGLIVLGPPDADDLAEARSAGCTWLHCDYVFLDAAVVAKIADAGMRAGAWTVNEPDDAQRLAEMGVACIITDTDDVLERIAPVAEPNPAF